MGAFLKFVFIFSLIYLLFRLLAKTFIPNIFNRLVRKVLFGNSKPQSNFDTDSKKDGEITITKSKELKKNKEKNTGSFGEYTDYEEIK